MVVDEWLIFGVFVCCLIWQISCQALRQSQIFSPKFDCFVKSKRMKVPDIDLPSHPLPCKMISQV